MLRWINRLAIEFQKALLYYSFPILNSLTILLMADVARSVFNALAAPAVASTMCHRLRSPSLHVLPASCQESHSIQNLLCVLHYELLHR